MALVPDRLPAPLSARAASTIASLAGRNGRPVDYALAGIPFQSAVSKDFPFTVQTADVKKAQVDTSPEPGEHTLTGWWIRAQSSWHEGAGNKYQELVNTWGTNVRSYRFYDSQNIDPWTKGEVKLLRKAVTVPLSEALRCVANTGGGPILGGGDGFLALFNTDGSGWNKLGGFLTDQITDVTQLASNLYVGATDGKLDVWDNTTGTVSTKSLTLDATVPAGLGTGAATNPRLLCAKYRLWACAGRFLYEQAIVDIQSDADGTVIPSLFVNPDPRWTYTDVMDGPSAVYFSGYSLSGESSIQKIVLDNTGATPTLTAGVTTAVMPPGEIVYRIDSLGGTYVGIGTNRGFRVGQISSSGDIAYGPLTVVAEPGSASNPPQCYAVQAYDRFFYVSFSDGSNDGHTFAVDVSQLSSDGTAAYARHVEVGTGAVRDIAVCPDGRLVVAAVDSADAPVLPLVQDVSQLCDSGWINYGYIRYDMQEPKIFKRAGVTTDPLSGSVMVELLNNGGTTNVYTYNNPGVADHPECDIDSSFGPRSEVAVRLTLAPDPNDNSAGPVVHSYWVKALPAVRPQRVWQVPLLCYDREKYRNGQEYGFDGFALERLHALQAAENSQDMILWQVFRTEVPFGQQVVIDKLQYVEQFPEGFDVIGAGGVIIATLRTLD